MNALRAELGAAGAVVIRDLRITMSYRTRFATHLVSVFFSLTLFHFIAQLVRVSNFSSPDAYYAFAVIGLISLQVLNSTLMTPPGGLRQELVAGTFERLLVSPFGAVRGMLASLVFPLLYALTTSIAMLVFAGAVFGVRLDWGTLPLVVPVGLLGALSFAPFGVLFLALMLVTKQAAAGASFVVAGISLIAGLYFPVALLPGWIQWAATVQPFTPAVDLLRHVMVGSELHDHLWLELVKLIGFTVALLPLAICLLALTLRISRRGGTVLEY